MIANIPITVTKGGQIQIPVTYTNHKNNKSAKINVLPDTGATTDFLTPSVARTLGIEITSGQKVSFTTFGKAATTSGVYRHGLLLKVGNLKPIVTLAIIDTNGKNDQSNIMGMLTMLQFKKVTFRGRTLVFEEKDAATSVQKQAAYADAYRSFYGYPRWYRKRI